MKRMIRAIVIGFTLLQITPLGAGEVTSRQILNTEAFVCDGQLQTRIWTNDIDDLRIKAVSLWMGMDRGYRADYVAALSRGSDGTQLFVLGWDHYADPVAPSTYSKRFSPDYVRLDYGDDLVLHARCMPADPSNTFGHGHVAATIDYGSSHGKD